MSHCLCCHNTLLRHIRQSQVYWYCPNCHQEMPQATATLSFKVCVSNQVQIASLSVV